jgi:hypothetical protein
MKSGAPIGFTEPFSALRVERSKPLPFDIPLAGDDLSGQHTAACQAADIGLRPDCRTASRIGMYSRPVISRRAASPLLYHTCRTSPRGGELSHQYLEPCVRSTASGKLFGAGNFHLIEPSLPRAACVGFTKPLSVAHFFRQSSAGLNPGL